MYKAWILIFLFLSLPESIANSKMGQNIKQYLTIGANNLISEIYKSLKFEKV